LLAHRIKRFAAFLDELANRYAGDTGGGPKKYLRRSMFSDHLSLHLIGVDIKMLRQIGKPTAFRAVTLNSSVPIGPRGVWRKTEPHRLPRAA